MQTCVREGPLLVLLIALMEATAAPSGLVGPAVAQVGVPFQLEVVGDGLQAGDIVKVLHPAGTCSGESEGGSLGVLATGTSSRRISTPMVVPFESLRPLLICYKSASMSEMQPFTLLREVPGILSRSQAPQDVPCSIEWSSVPYPPNKIQAIVKGTGLSATSLVSLHRQLPCNSSNVITTLENSTVSDEGEELRGIFRLRSDFVNVAFCIKRNGEYFTIRSGISFTGAAPTVLSVASSIPNSFLSGEEVLIKVGGTSLQENDTLVAVAGDTCTLGADRAGVGLPLPIESTDVMKVFSLRVRDGVQQVVLCYAETNTSSSKFIGTLSLAQLKLSGLSGPPSAQVTVPFTVTIVGSALPARGDTVRAYVSGVVQGAVCRPQDEVSAKAVAIVPRAPTSLTFQMTILDRTHSLLHLCYHTNSSSFLIGDIVVSAAPYIGLIIADGTASAFQTFKVLVSGTDLPTSGFLFGTVTDCNSTDFFLSSVETSRGPGFVQYTAIAPASPVMSVCFASTLSGPVSPVLSQQMVLSGFQQRGWTYSVANIGGGTINVSLAVNGLSNAPLTVRAVDAGGGCGGCAYFTTVVPAGMMSFLMNLVQVPSQLCVDALDGLGFVQVLAASSNDTISVRSPQLCGYIAPKVVAQFGAFTITILGKYITQQLNITVRDLSCTGRLLTPELPLNRIDTNTVEVPAIEVTSAGLAVCVSSFPCPAGVCEVLPMFGSRTMVLSVANPMSSNSLQCSWGTQFVSPLVCTVSSLLFARSPFLAFVDSTQFCQGLVLGRAPPVYTETVNDTYIYSYSIAMDSNRIRQPLFVCWSVNGETFPFQSTTGLWDTNVAPYVALAVPATPVIGSDWIVSIGGTFGASESFSLAFGSTSCGGVNTTSAYDVSRKGRYFQAAFSIPFQVAGQLVQGRPSICLIRPGVALAVDMGKWGASVLPQYVPSKFQYSATTTLDKLQRQPTIAVQNGGQMVVLISLELPLIFSNSIEYDISVRSTDCSGPPIQLRAASEDKYAAKLTFVNAAQLQSEAFGLLVTATKSLGSLIFCLSALGLPSIPGQTFTVRQTRALGAGQSLSFDVVANLGRGPNEVLVGRPFTLRVQSQIVFPNSIYRVKLFPIGHPLGCSYTCPFGSVPLPQAPALTQLSYQVIVSSIGTWGVCFNDGLTNEWVRLTSVAGDIRVAVGNTLTASLTPTPTQTKLKKTESDPPLLLRVSVPVSTTCIEGSLRRPSCVDVRGGRTRAIYSRITVLDSHPALSGNVTFRHSYFDSYLSSVGYRTLTLTFTPTVSTTISSTRTALLTISRTATASASQTRSFTQTLPATITASPTSSPTPSTTKTRTSTNTATATATATSTPTTTGTATSTSTSTSSTTPTFTRTRVKVAENKFFIQENGKTRKFNTQVDEEFEMFFKIVVPPSVPNGTYVFSSMTVGDAFNNWRTYTSADVQGLQGLPTFNVSSDNVCTCIKGVCPSTGTALEKLKCSICEGGWAGVNCDKSCVCPVDRGVCSAGISGTGLCQSCLGNYDLGIDNLCSRCKDSYIISTGCQKLNLTASPDSAQVTLNKNTFTLFTTDTVNNTVPRSLKATGSGTIEIVGVGVGAAPLVFTSPFYSDGVNVRVRTPVQFASDFSMTNARLIAEAPVEFLTKTSTCRGVSFEGNNTIKSSPNHILSVGDIYCPDSVLLLSASDDRQGRISLFPTSSLRVVDYKTLLSLRGKGVDSAASSFSSFSWSNVVLDVDNSSQILVNAENMVISNARWTPSKGCFSVVGGSTVITNAVFPGCAVVNTVGVSIVPGSFIVTSERSIHSLAVTIPQLSILGGTYGNITVLPGSLVVLDHQRFTTISALQLSTVTAELSLIVTNVNPDASPGVTIDSMRIGGSCSINASSNVTWYDRESARLLRIGNRVGSFVSVQYIVPGGIDINTDFIRESPTVEVMRASLRTTNGLRGGAQTSLGPPVPKNRTLSVLIGLFCGCFFCCVTSVAVVKIFRRPKPDSRKMHIFESEPMHNIMAVPENDEHDPFADSARK